jgi:hypothetical protein
MMQKFDRWVHRVGSTHRDVHVTVMYGIHILAINIRLIIITANLKH